MADQGAEKTEQPTPKRLEDARKKGNVSRSMEVNSAFILLTGTLTLFFVSGYMFQQLSFLMRHVFGGLMTYEISQSAIRPYAFSLMMTFVKLIAPILLAILVVGLLVNIGQVGFLFTLEPITPKPEKLDPLKGIQKVISIRSVVELIKGILKIFIIGYVIYLVIKGHYEDYFLLMDQSTGQIFSFMMKTIFQVSIWATLILIVLAAADFAYQRWNYLKDLRMTKDEVKQELKEYEGDPQVKGRIRNIQREMARKRMIADIPKADVVITNPIHYAVALKYDSEKMEAPRVLAKGSRKLALKIKEIARERGIPVVENPPLARALYKSTQIGMEIPVDLFQSVAEVLAYIYRLNGRQSA
ncbi:flagellar biosynthetic protein FlhB [bacterium BMS3Abin05]|nr:flagellar biosynthetic protein FlhB [bacterium BMS3Abin05]GBE28839.1 flagellar biosynthetic protein FlhB [bacterium BMS3Bbin03]HDL78186.1 flagellar biosynthesis protein FlhB [Bacteroidota bacterium]HDZ11085.1 flagellar biosynthesis protein FlhB [Bacteroidota bacterium]